ncbi:unnamed protein product, partial [Discosporangium mesarthrocarpum]
INVATGPKVPAPMGPVPDTPNHLKYVEAPTFIGETIGKPRCSSSGKTEQGTCRFSGQIVWIYERPVHKEQRVKAKQSSFQLTELMKHCRRKNRKDHPTVSASWSSAVCRAVGEGRE